MSEINIRSITGTPETLLTLDLFTRQVIAHIMALSGFTLVAGTVETGATLTTEKSVVLEQTSLKTYRWTGAFPCTISGEPLTYYGNIGTAWIEETTALPDLSSISEISEFTQNLLKNADLSSWIAALGLEDSLALKANLSSPIFTGIPLTPNPDTTNNTQVTNVQFVLDQISAAISKLGFTKDDLTAIIQILDLKASTDSPTFTGLPVAPTPDVGIHNTQIATTEFVGTAIANIVDSAPSTLNTFKQVATSLGNSPTLAEDVYEELALRAPLASPHLTGTPTAPTAEIGNISEQLATTEFVKQAIDNIPEGNALLVDTNVQLGTSYTLQLSDVNKCVEMNNVNANTVIVPSYADVAFPIGCSLLIRQYGRGATTIVAANGVYIRNPHYSLSIRTQFGTVALYHKDANIWCIVGSLMDE